MSNHIFNKKNASIILKGKFETGKSNKNNHMSELQKFVDYISRQEAIRQDKIEFDYTSEELAELSRIEKGLEKLDEDTDQPLIKDIRQLDKYIDYMTRKKAILENEQSEIINGAFSNNKRYITKNDVENIKGLVVQSKKNNSVMFQDIISFDNEFLEREGYYNSKTGVLNEDVLYEATKAMMEKLKEKEELVDPFWFATIHRNTDNIHLHITSMERENTREMMEYEGVLQARGKRKQSSLNEMIFKFGSKMIDRTNEFDRMSVLRKEVPLQIKETVKESLIDTYTLNTKKNDPQLEKMLEEIINEYPIKSRGYNELSPELKNKIDFVTNYITKDDPKRKEYDQTTKDIDQLYQSTYGSRYNPNEFYENRKNDFNSRMGNAVAGQVKLLKQSQLKGVRHSELEEILNGKKLSIKFESKDIQFKTSYGKENYSEFKNNFNDKSIRYNSKSNIYEKIKNRQFNRKVLHKIERVVNDDLKMYRAKRDFEKVQQMIERESMQQKNQFDFDY